MVLTPKQFRGAIYESSEARGEESRGLPSGTAVFVSELVTFRTEVRTFVLDRVVLDAAALRRNIRGQWSDRICPNSGAIHAASAC